MLLRQASALFRGASTGPGTTTPAAPVEQVLRDLEPEVRRWVARYLGPSPELDDAVQEALIALAAALPRFEGRSRLTTYARRIALRSAGRHVRRLRATPAAPGLVAVPTEELNPERLAMGREGVDRLYRALGALSDKRRRAFVLCAIEKLPHEEAAEVEGCSLVTLRARLRHARADLTGILADDPYLAPLFRRAPDAAKGRGA